MPPEARSSCCATLGSSAAEQLRISWRRGALAPGRCRARVGLRHRQHALDGARQLLGRGRLGKAGAVRNLVVAHAAGGNIAGQNDDGKLATQHLPYLRCKLQPVQFPGKFVVRQDEVRLKRMLLQQCQSRSAVACHDRIVAVDLEQFLEQLAHLGIVLHDQDEAAAAIAGTDVRVPVSRILPRSGIGRFRPDIDGKDRTLSRDRSHTYAMAEQFRQALHDGKPEAHAAVGQPCRIVELAILLEDRLQFGRRDAYAGVPHLDAQASRPPAAAEKDLAVQRVFEGVGEQVAEHLLEQARIAVDRKT